LSADKAEGWNINSFTGIDMTNGSYVMLFSKDVQPGHYISSDTLINSQFKQYLKTQYSNIRTNEINIQGYKAIRYTARNSTQPNIHLNALSVIKHNRNIVLLVLTDSTQRQVDIQKTFSSFQFI